VGYPHSWCVQCSFYNPSRLLTDHIGLNQLLFFRYPSVAVGPLVAQLLSFPVGQAWASIVPRWKVFGISLNPGPFTIKEHVVITIMAGVSAGSAYAVSLCPVPDGLAS
jgi:hypothetical protein